MNVTIGNIENLIPERDRDLVFRFFIVFSRFEYSLKRAGFLMRLTGTAEASWDSFSSKYHADFNPSQTSELQDAYQYLATNPPRKQLANAGSLTWSAPLVRGNEPVLTWLLLVIRTVRNNLFHGGKFPFASSVDPIRDPILLRHVLTIIGACVHLNPEVARQFKTYE
jgi:hypothetical protein